MVSILGHNNCRSLGKAGLGVLRLYRRVLGWVVVAGWWMAKNEVTARKGSWVRYLRVNQGN